jgi:hypothetical protein
MGWATFWAIFSKTHLATLISAGVVDAPVEQEPREPPRLPHSGRHAAAVCMRMLQPNAAGSLRGVQEVGQEREAAGRQVEARAHTDSGSQLSSGLVPRRAIDSSPGLPDCLVPKRPKSVCTKIVILGIHKHLANTLNSQSFKDAVVFICKIFDAK